MLKYKKKDAFYVVFIDFKSAYNTVNREILYNILKEKCILGEDEITFLRKLHDSLFFEVDNKKYYFDNGVH